MVMLDRSRRPSMAELEARQHDAASRRFHSAPYARQGWLDRRERRAAFEQEPTPRKKVRRSLMSERDGLGLERVMGLSDLVEVNFLEIGQRVAKSVCRITIRMPNGAVYGYGTGFLVSDHVLLTNNHVLPTAEIARRSVAEFDYQSTVEFVPKQVHAFLLDPDRLFLTDQTLDFTVVAVERTGVDGAPLELFGSLPLLRESGKVIIGEYVSIVQHPNGAPKQLALRENQVLGAVGHFLHYLTDTLPGSSGSPVFNDQWQVVALHHSGVRKMNEQGQTLSLDGVPWEPTMGDERIAWIANEGVRIGSILAAIEERLGDLPEVARTLLAPVVQREATPSAPAEREPTVEVVERSIESYARASGYDPRFLGIQVELPRVGRERAGDVAPLRSGSGHVLDYTHFSIVMSKSRRLALFTAVNVDGASLVEVKRSGAERWAYDPRIERAHQCGPELYARNELDRGHLVRRIDPTWGDEARAAEADTFHFTNSVPQHARLNQRTWQNLENYILANAEKYGFKVSIFTGPVFREDDMLYRGEFRIPAEFWKVVVVNATGRLASAGYLQSQKNLIQDLEFAYGPYRTYQVPVSRIEALTGLDFGVVRDADGFRDEERVGARVIEGAEDVRL